MSVKYSVQSNGESASFIAAQLATNITSEPALNGRVSASSTGAVITLTSVSPDITWYKQAVTVGSETITLSSQSKGTAVQVSPSQAFAANPPLVSGNNTANLTVLSGGGTATSQPYKINISGPSTSTLTYDDNGNTTSDGTNTFDWDAEDRLIKITFSGSGNHTDFSYDPLSRPVKIVEFTSGSVTSTKQFIWCGSEMCEERDASSSLNDGKQFLSLGQINFSGGTGTNRLYQLSHKDIVGATN